MSTINRREFLNQVAAGTAAMTIPTAAAPGSMPPGSTGPVSTAAAGLAEPAFRPLPLGSIRPQGWLLRQLQIQAAGLTGHLDEFWPDVGQSQWFGGTAEGWERAPYWLDGFIPLAWTLDDPALKAKASKYVEYIVSHQRPDGWFSPYPADAATKKYDLWAILLADKVLAQYHDATGDERVLKTVERSLRAMLAGLDRTPLYDWGRYRWFEGLVSVFHVYERTRRGVASRARPQAPRPGIRLSRVLQGRGRHGPHAAARPLEMGQACRQHGDGPQGFALWPGASIRPRQTGIFRGG